ncbi:MAG: hypothetical protein EOO07_21780 [Chitinophagaceae bacterium]|nr:MAG: hypothetical protein EOO07_21780 [Chitinophagaceae bacterium]
MILDKVLERRRQELLAKYGEYLAAESELYSHGTGAVSREYFDKMVEAKKAWDKAYAEWFNALKRVIQ